MAVQLDDFPTDYLPMEILGRGGFGEVWKARAPGGLDVAVKFPNTEDNNTIERFRREATLQSNLSDPNVMEILDFDLGCRRPWLAMPLARNNLDEELSRSDTSPDTILDLYQQALSGIRYSHENHVLHRDLKPANILIMADTHRGNIAKVSDFGLSRRFTRGEESFETGTFEAYGTRWFAPPEQWVDFKEVGATADIFSLGRILEYIAVRRREIFDAHPALRHCIKVATQADPYERYQSVSQLINEISLVTQGPNIMSRPIDDAKAAVQEVLLASPGDRSALERLLSVLSRNSEDHIVLQQLFSRIPYEVLDALVTGHGGEMRPVLVGYVASLSTPLPVDAGVRAANLLDRVLEVAIDAVLRSTSLSGLIQLAALYDMWEFTGVALHRLQTEVDHVALLELASLLRNSELLRNWIVQRADELLLPAVLRRELRPNG